uniref:F-actin-capping protein subunit beta n=1 Tax=Lactuca sativa TaxID=4236 RepID=A0A9R1UPH0_LACSA|nr:hypothetical protein LSAT_V11C800417850 [Lactuca sativa]
MKQKGVKPGLDHYMCIINMLIKAGQLNEALSFIVSTPSKWDVFAWTALLSACRLSRVLCDVDSAKEFILCDYNRDADSYTSPWSNKYHPPLEEGLYPSPELRTLEIEANEVFSVYRDQYYEGGTSSMYLWEDDEKEGFLACFLIKKDGSKYAHGVRGYLNEEGWDAIHLIEVGPEVEGMADYCLISTLMLSMTTDHENSGTFSLSGSIRRQVYDLLILIMSD